ncbi:MAG: 2-C-methyl-D-erythritol 4-phosphate cytidylyltransferase [Bacteroidetes bacterium 4484_249]|nr:MAG: 2-C-methyl-D-erythritol 4-phosphate cytidylyltransferase [Bacteroidetes bacterium 4484_249]
MNKQVLIVAGGIGKRMLSNIPKQFLTVAGKPLLFHTFECFNKFSIDISITLVIPEFYADYWQSLITKFNFKIDHRVAFGGETRYHSVNNGLDLIRETGLIAIHDGVRPLVTKGTLKRVFATAEKKGNAIPVIPVNESMRKLHKKKSKPIDRENFRLVQTPQCFHSDLIKKAYEQEYRKEFTDDATVVEAMGVKINLVEGNAENIKITSPVDLKIAAAFLK